LAVRGQTREAEAGAAPARGQAGSAARSRPRRGCGYHTRNPDLEQQAPASSSGYVRRAGEARHARTAQGASRLTPFGPREPAGSRGETAPCPREPPRPHRGAPDKSSGPCARGAAEGPSPWCGARFIPSQNAEKGKESKRGGGSKGLKAACSGPCGGSDGLTCMRT